MYSWYVKEQFVLDKLEDTWDSYVLFGKKGLTKSERKSPYKATEIISGRTLAYKLTVLFTSCSRNTPHSKRCNSDDSDRQ